ncbi:integral membrane protein TmpA [Coniella lustricola]|uniref:Integral membrane protein TmpA n=1 Tax=Coniella lustricola TaxID=2025994 RepID=A0A2T3ANI8_9PEZI|nr:integral membrane protein TmpA [Coniella lustricola]
MREPLSSSETLVIPNSEVVAPKKSLQSFELESQEEVQLKSKLNSTLRYTVLNTYRRLFSLVFLGNLAAIIAVIVRQRYVVDLLTGCAANVMVCGLARQPLVVNSLFYVFCLIPTSTPIRLRHLACKIFHLGGVHSGCGVASLLWYIAFFGVYCYQFELVSSSATSIAMLVLAALILCVLLAVILVTWPRFRETHHDAYEFTHRFGSWTILALFWALVLVFASNQAAPAQSMGLFLLSQPAFWFLLITTLAIIHPWTLLRKVDVVPEPLSTHVVRLHLNYASIVYGQAISMSRHPLRDWHSFAVIPDRFDSPNTRFSVLVSKAGDWTSSVIADQPRKIWVRGIPTSGFAYVMRLFSRIIVVATGSGIGPCVALIDDDNRPAMRVIWQTRAPRKTYGDRTLDLVHRLDANPMIIDTSEQGRVDMVPPIMRLYREMDAEAVCIISNGVMTKKLVFDLERRGVRAYGPIFDS